MRTEEPQNIEYRTAVVADRRSPLPRSLLLLALLLLASLLTPHPSPCHAAVMPKETRNSTSAIAGEALVLGDIVCIKASDGKAYKASASDSALRPAVGFASTVARAGVGVRITTAGVFAGYTGLTVGQPVYLSATAGTYTQTATEDWYQQIGTAITAGSIQVAIKAPQAAASVFPDQTGKTGKFLKSTGTAGEEEWAAESDPVAGAVNGIVKSNGSAAFGAADYTDIAGLWATGSCAGYLKSDGSCDNPGDNETRINRLIAEGATIPGGDNGSIQYNNNGAFGGKTLTTADVSDILSWLGDQLVSGNLTSLVIGDGNFTVDSSGNVTHKSAGSIRTDDPSYIKFYEATSKGNKWVAFRAPVDGFISDGNSSSGGNETIYELPRDRPIFGEGHMGILWPSLASGDSVSQGKWAYLLNVYSPFSGLLKTSGSSVVAAAMDGVDYLSPTGVATVTNKAIVLARVVGSDNDTLTAAEVSGTVIDNTGQHLLPVKIQLPLEAAGQNFTAMVGETQSVAAHWRFVSQGTGKMCLDGNCTKSEIKNAQPVRGDILRCHTALAATNGVTSSATLAVGTDPTQVKTAAFGYDLGGTYYTKTAVDGTVPGDDVIPEDKYGAIALDIDNEGTITVAEATDNAAGYTTAALALAGLPAVDAGKLRIGTVTAMKSDGAFTFGTTSLSDAAVTEAYASTAVYTKGYVWMCESAVGTWEAN